MQLRKLNSRSIRLHLRLGCTRARKGFTLIELVLVLVILAVLATAAINMVEVEVDQARFESTQQTVEVIQRAVLGPDHARAADGSRVVSGFVADCGRLPHSLEELYLRPSAQLPAFESQSPDGDAEVTVNGGWNGPYLQLAVGGTSLPDGWAAGFEPYKSDGTISGPTEPIAMLRSLGRDQAVGGSTYDADISLIFQADAGAVPNLAIQQENRWQKPLTVYVFYRDSATNPDPENGQKIVVRLYGPVAEEATGVVTLGTIAQEKPSTEYTTEAPVAVLFENLSVGPRIIRAYQMSSDPASDDQELSAVAQALSVPARVVISRETSSIQLILRDN
ncbi:MAG: prepilin-type N-terminal cleavage/methylation domain-containing protein [Rubripirellula sp.]|nr:prepilin-type N-terminal cleavage/methylation domain-containing protein [Rubripirellula sp.]